MFTINFWKDAAERAVKTAAQSLILFWGAAEVANVMDFDWQNGLGIAAAGAVLSVLTSLVSAPVSNKGTASLTTEVEYKP